MRLKKKYWKSRLRVEETKRPGNDGLQEKPRQKYCWEDSKYNRRTVTRETL